MDPLVEEEEDDEEEEEGEEEGANDEPEFVCFNGCSVELVPAWELPLPFAPCDLLLGVTVMTLTIAPGTAIAIGPFISEPMTNSKTETRIVCG